MSLDESVVEGTLNPDGTLDLDQKPSIAPGRVTVILRQHVEPAAPPQESMWEFLKRSRRELEASGSPFMNEQEMNAHIEWLREEDPIDEMLRQAVEFPTAEERS